MGSVRGGVLRENGLFSLILDSFPEKVTVAAIPGMLRFSC